MKKIKRAFLLLALVGIIALLACSNTKNKASIDNNANANIKETETKETDNKETANDSLNVFRGAAPGYNDLIEVELTMDGDIINFSLSYLKYLAQGE